ATPTAKNSAAAVSLRFISACLRRVISDLPLARPLHDATAGSSVCPRRIFVRGRRDNLPRMTAGDQCERAPAPGRAAARRAPRAVDALLDPAGQALDAWRGEEREDAGHAGE